MPANAPLPPDAAPYFTTGTGSPVGAVTPQRVGHIYVATDLENAWIATNTTNADWEQIDAAGGGGGPSVSTGAGAPVSTPTAEGDIYIDTTNDESYMAVGTAGAGDWKKTSNLPQGLTAVSDDNSPTLGGNLDGGGNSISNVSTVTATGDIFTQTGINLTHIGLNNTSTSILEGGLLTINGGDNTKYDISDGTVCIADNFADPSNPTLSVIEFTGLTARAVTDITNDSRSYIGIRLDNVAPTGGTATAITVTINGTGGQTAYLVDKPDIDFTLTERREIAVLGLLPHPSTFILFTLPLVDLAVSPHLAMVDLAQSIGPINRTGNVYSANGANLQINKSAGETFRIGTNYADTEATRKAPNITTDAASVGMTFRMRYQAAVSGFTETGDLTNIDPNQYDNGTGTLASVGNNKWTIQWLFYFGATDSARFQYGQTEYNSFAAAEEALLGGTEKSNFEVDPNFLSNATLRGWLIVKKGATDLSDSSEAQFLEAGRFEQTVVGGGTTSTTTLQQAYDNSVSPEITTNTALGALSVKRGSAADTDDVIEAQNGAGSQVMAVTGQGNITLSGTVDGRDIATDGTKLDGIAAGAEVNVIESVVEDTTPQLGGDLDGNNFSVKNIDDLTIDEAADHTTTPAAGFSTIWVRNDTPTTLMHSDDAGNDYELHQNTACFYFCNVPGGQQWTNMPAADTLFVNSGAQIWADLTRFTEVRLAVMRGGNASQAGALAHLRYHTTGSSTVGDFTAIGDGGAECEADIQNGSSLTKSGWVTLASGAKADVVLAIVTSGGNGVQDPGFITIQAQFR